MCSRINSAYQSLLSASSFSHSLQGHFVSKLYAHDSPNRPLRRAEWKLVIMWRTMSASTLEWPPISDRSVACKAKSSIIIRTGKPGRALTKGIHAYTAFRLTFFSFCARQFQCSSFTILLLFVSLSDIPRSDSVTCKFERIVV